MRWDQPRVAVRLMSRFKRYFSPSRAPAHRVALWALVALAVATVAAIALHLLWPDAPGFLALVIVLAVGMGVADHVVRRRADDT
jgi:anti-sigma-K factor RskA